MSRRVMFAHAACPQYLALDEESATRREYLDGEIYAAAASRQLIASEIQRFVDRPAEPTRRVASPGPPPGAPIGSAPTERLPDPLDDGWTGSARVWPSGSAWVRPPASTR